MKLSLTSLLGPVVVGPIVVGPVVCAAVVGALAVPAHAAPAAPEVPSTLVPPAGNQVFLEAHATGVQIYRCDAATGAWTLVAPRANLYADNGQLIGTHFGGPTWRARDGSYVTATKVDEVNLDPTAVNWLLLAMKTRSAGADGDRLAATTYIQRTATTGGRAPAASECDVTGEIAEIAYTADYHFWKATVA
jgi:hypothetical protein